MKQEIELRPLTRKATYIRLPEIETQIRAALVLDKQTLQERVGVRDYADEAFIQEEALVYLIRCFRHEGDFVFVEVLVTALIERIKKKVDKRISFPLDPSYVNDCYTDAIGEIVGQIIDEKSDRCDFAEVRFWVWLDARVLNVLIRYIRRQRKDALTDNIENTADDANTPDFAETPGALRDKRLPVDIEANIWEALDVLDKRERLLYVMRYYWGWEIENEHPHVTTISRYFEVTPRTVRNWFAKAEQKLENWKKGRRV